MIRGLKITFPDIENTVEYLFEILIQNEKWLFSSTGRYDVGLHLHWKYIMMLYSVCLDFK